MNQQTVCISPADRYVRARDLCVITAYYNPCAYSSKRENYDRFIEPIRAAGQETVVVELAFGSEPFTLPGRDFIVRVRARDVLWQKERLLNHALRHVPRRCSKVAWIDADVLFSNPEWAIETSYLLDRVSVVQPFRFVVRLDRGAVEYRDNGIVYESFASTYRSEPRACREGMFQEHGHTGFAWAARRRILARHGLYDACISGSGDHVMAHAFVGSWRARCAKRIFGRNRAYYEHYKRWSKAVYRDVRGALTFAPGTLLHLWHGDIENRRYGDRNRTLEKLGFSPERDLRVAREGCWEWRGSDPALIEFMSEYFVLRREDG